MDWPTASVIISAVVGFYALIIVVAYTSAKYRTN